MSEAEPRLACPRCQRPLGVCFCQHITPRTTRTRLILLQHPRERRMGIGTARFAHLALAGSTLRVDVDFSHDPVVRAALDGPAPSYVLFPGPGALAAEQLPARGPLNLFVVDGT